MGGATTCLQKWIPSGRDVVVEVALIAPETKGEHIGYWILTASDGTAFGSYVYVKTVV
jgi:hypothetical protein